MSGSDRIRLDSGEDDPQRPLVPDPAPSGEIPPPETAEAQDTSGEPPAQTTEEAPDDLKKRVDMLTRQKYEAQRQRDEYAAMLAARQQQPYMQPQYQQQQPADPIEAARAEGRQQAHEQVITERFNEACNSLFRRGQEEYGDMPDAVSALNAVGYGNRPDVLAALTKLPDGHRVYRELASNLDRAAQVLALDPMAMALELAQMSQSQRGNGVARETPPVSRTPAPLRPVGGTATPAAKPLDKMSMAEFIRTRDRQERRSRISR